MCRQCVRLESKHAHRAPDLKIWWLNRNCFHAVDWSIGFCRIILSGSEYFLIYKLLRTNQNCPENPIDQSSAWKQFRLSHQMFKSGAYAPAFDHNVVSCGENSRGMAPPFFLATERIIQATNCLSAHAFTRVHVQ